MLRDCSFSWLVLQHIPRVLESLKRTEAEGSVLHTLQGFIIPVQRSGACLGSEVKCHWYLDLSEDLPFNIMPSLRLDYLPLIGSTMGLGPEITCPQQMKDIQTCIAEKPRFPGGS